MTRKVVTGAKAVGLGYENIQSGKLILGRLKVEIALWSYKGLERRFRIRIFSLDKVSQVLDIGVRSKGLRF